MIKSIAILKRKPGLSREEFIKHYEEVHAPLVLKHIPMLRRYVRNHVIPVSSPHNNSEPDFDCITEFWVDDMEGSQEAGDIWTSEAGRAIREDEETFLDRSKIITFLVEEKVSAIQCNIQSPP